MLCMVLTQQNLGQKHITLTQYATPYYVIDEYVDCAQLSAGADLAILSPKATDKNPSLKHFLFTQDFTTKTKICLHRFRGYIVVLYIINKQKE